ncbi:MAG: hypothetical protein WCR52_10455 [Bacteroidota bacterium]
MQDNLLTKLIRDLGKRERRALLQWVSSPAHNTRADVKRLCDHLCAHTGYGETDEPESNLDAQSVSAVVFPPETQKGRPVQPRQLHDVTSWLLSAAKEWLVYEAQQNDPTDRQIRLCRTLRRRGCTKLYEQETRKLLALPLQAGADAYLQLYRIRFEAWEARHRQPGSDAGPLFDAATHFGAFVCISALRHGCAALDKAADPLQLDFLPESLALLEAGRYAEIPGAQVYYHCFRLMQRAETRHFYALRDLLAQHSAAFPPEEIRDVWLVAINFCIRQVNTGERAVWTQEALNLYKQGLDLEVIMENGRLSRATYYNILLLAVSTGAWEWAWDFLHQYRKNLAPGEQHTGFHFGLATWHFRRREYDAAQDILRSVEFRDAGMNLDARRMLVRIYFDRNELEALDALLHSFRIYLQRHRNIGYHKDLNLNFLRMVNQLIRLEPGDSAGRRKLAQKIRELPMLAEREWLLEKSEQ